jgi:hypothetical protein
MTDRHLYDVISLNFILFGVVEFIFIVLFRMNRMSQELATTGRKSTGSSSSLLLGSLLKMRMLFGQLFHHVFQTAPLFVFVRQHSLPFATLCLSQLGVFTAGLNHTNDTIDKSITKATEP